MRQEKHLSIKMKTTRKNAYGKTEVERKKVNVDWENETYLMIPKRQRERERKNDNSDPQQKRRIFPIGKVYLSSAKNEREKKTCKSNLFLLNSIDKI